MDSCRLALTLSAALCLFHVVYGAGTWGYFGDDDETHWTSVDAKCGGNSQSPIDIITSSASYENYPAFSLSGFDTTTSLTLTLENNGHTAKLTPSGVTPKVTGGGLGTEYTMAQLHFHWGKTSSEGSEHRVNGVKYPMEMHIVTYKSSHGGANAAALADSSGLAVLGFFFEVGTTAHPGIQKLIDGFSGITSSGATSAITAFRLDELMPSSFPSFYRYSGSLTTPTCNEAVVWTVFANTIKVTEAQLNAFRALQASEQNDAGNNNMYNNFRNPQALNGRKVTANFDANTGFRPSFSLSLMAVPLLSMLLKFVL